MAKRTISSDQTIIKYLLNDLSGEEEARFEQAYLSDESLFEQVKALEEELIEDYVKGDLSARERDLFERHYLASNQRRARVETARQLVRICSSKSLERPAANNRNETSLFSPPSFLRSLAQRRLIPVFGVATALLALLSAGLVIELLRQRGQFRAVNNHLAVVERRAEESEQRLTLEREQAVDLREKLENLNNQLARLERGRGGSQPPDDQTVFLTLTPGRRDPSGADRAVITARTSFVELRVELEGQEAANRLSYRAVVKTVEGNMEIWTQRGIRSQGHASARYILVRAPADRFRSAATQDFMLTFGALTAGGKDYEDIDGCYFRVIAK